ncbi:MAG: DUF4174 domain-containing protein [Chloroflexota bacterium]|nr:DUF4174 domain-containing protein [Chloroflexota bacterium]
MSTNELEAYQDQKRLLLIFATSITQPAYIEQQTLLQGHEGEGEARDLLVFHLLGDGISFVAEAQLAAEAVANLRRRFGVAEAVFTLVLIGKDGTEKWRAGQPTPLPEIFAKIDSMPMRRHEMADASRK